MSSTPIWAMGLPTGPIEKGMTYIVRPLMQPLNRAASLARMNAGSFQLFVGPASACFAEQMNMRSSTRATSEGSEHVRYELGRFCGLSRSKQREPATFRPVWVAPCVSSRVRFAARSVGNPGHSAT